METSNSQITTGYLIEFSKNLKRIEQFERIKVLLERIISHEYDVLI